MTISSQTRKAGPYIGAGTTSTFPFEFKVFQASDLLVVELDVATNVETTLELDSDYTVSLNADQNADPGGSITLSANLATGKNLVVSSQVPYLQETDLTNQGGFYPNVITNSLDKLTIQTQQLKEEVDRSAKLPITSDEDANALVADIVRIADSADNLDTVATNIADVNTVAGDIADVNTVADSITDVNTVATDIAAVTTVANDLNEPTSEIETVAGSITNVNTVGNNIANVNSVATNISNVNAVNSNASNINAVAGNATNINAVAGNATNINAVNANKTNIDAVAGNATNINSVASNASNINTAVTNMAAIVAAPTEAANAAASAAAAAAYAASGMYSAVQDKSANYTVVLGDAGDLIRMTTTSGALTVTLPQISSVIDGFNVTVVKWTGDINDVTIVRSGSDTINGGTSYVLDAQYKSATFVADAQTSTWFASGSGSSSTNIIVDSFNGTGSQTAFTLSGEPGTENNTQVFVSGVYQEKDTYSLSGSTLTFSVAPPSGTSNIEVVWSQPLAIGTPADGTVSTLKLADSAVTTAKLADGSVTAAKLASTTGSGAVVLASGASLASPTATTPTLTGTKETRVAVAASDIDLSAGNYFTKTISGTTTFTVSNVASSGSASSFILDLTNGGSATVNWWSGMKWAGGTAPTLTASGRDVLGFFTHDGGTTWNGLVLAKDIK